jgi:ABC-type branched-subunit amino acid transport system permease subunit
MSALLLIPAAWALVVVCWVLYLAIMNLAEHRHALHPVAKIHSYVVILPIGYVVDALLNLLVCAIFLRRPRDWLLTGTLKRTLINESGWREAVAGWVCAHLLNQFDPKGRHC